MKPLASPVFCALALVLAAGPAAAQHAAGHGDRHRAAEDRHAAHRHHAASDRAGAAPKADAPTSPFPAPTAAERAAAFPPQFDAMDMASHMDDDPLVAVFRGDRLEYSDDDALGWDLRIGAGGAFDKLWLRSEGERRDRHLQHATTELAWHHATGPWWDRTLGVRHDAHPGGADRDWLALGVQGLAPYKFEVQATAYLGQGGRLAARLEAEYELLLTNRLILQPQLEANLYGRDDNANGLGSGLSDAALGLRLRYEFSRRFAPYVGHVWTRRFGGTACQAAATDEPDAERRWVLGVRFWL